MKLNFNEVTVLGYMMSINKQIHTAILIDFRNIQSYFRFIGF